jgi:hypothetical protein
MSFRTLSLGLALVALGCLLGCGSAESDPEEEILPGDPRFGRDPGLDVENISAKGEKRSHNMGQNCMNCHQAHGPGKGRFSSAGTVFDSPGKPLAGGSVELRSAPNGQGELILALDVDDNGNFFTTAPLPFPDSALFPTIKRSDGSIATFMPFPSISGACNVCHVGAQKLHEP